MNKPTFTLPLNLQLFAEDYEDAILPDDYQEAPPQAEEAPVETQEPGFEDFTEQAAEDTTPADAPVETQEPVTQPLKIPVKYNHQDMELTVEEAAALAQKGMNYEKAVQRASEEAAQQARDAVYAEMGLEWQGKPIKTEAEYKQALQEKQLLEKYSSLDPELAQELIESRRFREELQKQQADQAEQKKQQASLNEFFDYFEEVNERKFDPNKDQLPQEVLDAVNNGQTLLSAYMKHQNKELRNRLKIQIQNQANQKKAPVGSVTAGGGIKSDPEDLFIKGFNSV